MADSSLTEALKPLAARMPRVVREQEILRVRGTLPGPDVAKAADLARKEVLRWAQKRSGGPLPIEAWDLQNFEHLSGGRNCTGIRIHREASDIWCIRADDPDKTVAERIWTTEVVIGFVEGESPRFSARLLVSTPEEELDIEPHTPGFVQQVSKTCALSRDGYALRAVPWLISSSDEAASLIEMLSSPERRLPVFVLTVPPDANTPSQPLIDGDGLARAVLGMGHVIVLPAAHTWQLTEVFGKKRSVFGGAARAYLPGFSEDANPYSHRLFVADTISSREGASQCGRWFRRLAASESVRRLRLGHDVLSFASLRAASLEMGQAALENSGANEAERIKAMAERIAALERQAQEAKDALDYFSDENGKSEERAMTAEGQARASAYRIQQLLEQLKAKGNAPDDNLELPTKWGEFADWCDEALAGRVVLTPAARRGVKSPEFEDVAIAARSLLWLANEGRDRFTNGGGTAREIPIEDGIKNAHCGSTSFETNWHGQPYKVEWHIKNGGNTRAPTRCLRIYYFWDETSEQLVIAEMPAHRRTDAS